MVQRTMGILCVPESVLECHLIELQTPIWWRLAYCVWGWRRRGCVLWEIWVWTGRTTGECPTGLFGIVGGRRPPGARSAPPPPSPRGGSEIPRFRDSEIPKFKIPKYKIHVWQISEKFQDLQKNFFRAAEGRPPNPLKNNPVWLPLTSHTGYFMFGLSRMPAAGRQKNFFRGSRRKYWGLFRDCIFPNSKFQIPNSKF